jgi:hypothetical protein
MQDQARALAEMEGVDLSFLAKMRELKAVASAFSTPTDMGIRLLAHALATGKIRGSGKIRGQESLPNFPSPALLGGVAARLRAARERRQRKSKRRS